MLESYEFVAKDTEYTYTFYSIGKKGKIFKIVHFLNVNDKNDYFQFGFADYDEQTGLIDDKVISNNGDTALILATLGTIIESFTTKFPDAWIYAKGNTAVRTRFYRIVLSLNLSIIQQQYILMGRIKGVWKPFIPNQPYTDFLLKKK